MHTINFYQRGFFSSSYTTPNLQRKQTSKLDLKQKKIQIIDLYF